MYFEDNDLHFSETETRNKGRIVKLDKARIFILVTGLIIIIGFSLFTFMAPGPSSPKSGTKIQPVKKLVLINPTQKLNSNHEQTTLPQPNTNNIIKKIGSRAIPSIFYVASVSVSGYSSIANNTTNSQGEETNSTSSLDVFENKDVPENYYSVGFPLGANVVQGASPGSYIATISPYKYSTELQDIPDDSNVQLYTLTHAEPALKSSLSGYKLVSSGQLDIGGGKIGAAKNRAWDLVYTWKNSTQNLEAIKVFIEGKDQAAEFTFSSPVQDYAKNNSTVNSILANFRWLGQ